MRAPTFLLRNRWATLIRSQPGEDALRMSVIAISVCLAYVVSTLYFSSPLSGLMIWLPGGIALAGFLLFGMRVWPAALLAFLAGGLLSGLGYGAAFISSLVALLGTLVATWVLKYFFADFDRRILRQRDVWMLLLACFLQSLIFACCVLSPGTMANPINHDLYPYGFLDLWVSGFIGSAMITPFIMMAVSRKWRTSMLWQRPFEFALFVLISIAINWWVWIGWDAGFYTMTGTWLLAPAFIWAVARMGQRGVAILVMLTYAFAVASNHESYVTGLAVVVSVWDIKAFGLVLVVCSHLAAAIFNEHVMAKTAVLEAKKKLRSSQTYGGIGTWEADIASGRQYWSDYVVQELGFPKIAAPTWEDFIAIVIAEDRPLVIEATEAHLERGVKYDVRFRIMDVSGRLRTLRSAGQVERDAGGTPRMMRGMVQDISDLIDLEKSLHASEERYRALFQGTGDPIVIADFGGYIEDINRSAETLLGYDRAEVIGKHVCTIHPYSQLERVQRHFMQMTARGFADPLETQVLQKDGSIVAVEVRPTITEINGRKLLQGIFIDLTERKREEEQRHVEEAAHRNTLVREVHHRIKNNLQGIVGVLRQFAGSHPDVAHPVNEAISQVQSIAVIHGLQGRSACDKVRVCELTNTIAAGVSALWQFPVEVDIPAAWVPCTITEKEAVPLALVLNELLSNAVKHSKGGSVDVSIRHQPRPDTIALTIRNSGRMRPVAGTHKSAASSSGIDLVRSLLPRSGANLSWRQEGGHVVTELLLEPPIVNLDEEGGFVAYEF